jgi:hypothetical protein
VVVAPSTPLVQFKPAYYQSQVRLVEGRYGNLYAAESFALWVSPEVANAKWDQALAGGDTIEPLLKADAITVTQEFVIVECHLSSAFSDMSVAYDAVGLRGATAYLETPSGRKIQPLQQLFQGDLSEVPEGALRRFGRTIVLVFPKRDLWLRQPTLEAGAPSMKLVISGPQGRFAFEWPAVLPDAQPPKLTVPEAKAAVKVGFRDPYTNLRRLAHMFD